MKGNITHHSLGCFSTFAMKVEKTEACGFATSTPNTFAHAGETQFGIPKSRQLGWPVLAPLLLLLNRAMQGIAAVCAVHTTGLPSTYGGLGESVEIPCRSI